MYNMQRCTAGVLVRDAQSFRPRYDPKGWGVLCTAVQGEGGSIQVSQETALGMLCPVVLSQPEQSLHSAMQYKVNQTGPLWQWEEKEQGTSSFSSSPWAFEEGNGWGYETMKMPLSFGSQIPMYSPPLGATYRGWKDRIYKSCVPSYHTYEVASVWLRLCYPTTLEARTQNIVLRVKPQFAVNNDRRIYVEWDIHFVVIHTTVLKSKGLNWVG